MKRLKNAIGLLIMGMLSAFSLNVGVLGNASQVTTNASETKYLYLLDVASMYVHNVISYELIEADAMAGLPGYDMIVRYECCYFPLTQWVERWNRILIQEYTAPRLPWFMSGDDATRPSGMTGAGASHFSRPRNSASRQGTVIFHATAP